MNLKEITELLERNEKSNGRLSVLFVSKNGTEYQHYKPQLSNDLQRELIRMFKVRIQSTINDGKQEVEFNPSGHEMDEYSVCDYEYVGNFNEVIGLYDSENETELLADQISFLVYRLRVNKESDPEEYLYMFRRNHKFKSIRKGFWISKISNVYSKLISDDLIGIDGNIDALAYNNQLAFFAHISAERIFNLREKFAENARQILNKIEEGATIENFEEFRDACLNDARVTRRLTKIHSNPTIIELYHEHFSNAQEVIESFDLNIKFNDDKTKIIYTDKEELTDITMLMRDAYYRTILAKRTGIDDFN